MTSAEVQEQIEQVGVIPAVRLYSYEDALFATDTVSEAGIPIVEVTMTVPGAIELITQLVRTQPKLIVGAGTVLDNDTASHCINAGVKFLTSTGLDFDIIELAMKEKILIFPGVLTPTEVHAAQKAGCGLVKIFPCSQMGGPAYIRALKAPFPKLHMIASGGVTQANASEYILAGADALGIGGDLIPRKAIKMREAHWIRELARRFTTLVKESRQQLAAT